MNYIIENRDMYIKPQQMRVYSANTQNSTDCIVSVISYSQGLIPLLVLKLVDLTFLNELETVKQKKNILEQVTATVSHELLTPIKSIVAFSKILLM